MSVQDALQATVKAGAQSTLYRRAALNGTARRGEYRREMGRAPE